MQLKDWERAIEAEKPDLADFNLGPSPGGAANELGISRQAVHKAIHRGELDVLAIYDGRRLSHYTISRSSLAAYKAVLRDRASIELQRIAKRLA
jgi:predicted DNA-binding protein YlxM (UPF0122 family)